MHEAGFVHLGQRMGACLAGRVASVCGPSPSRSRERVVLKNTGDGSELRVFRHVTRRIAHSTPCALTLCKASKCDQLVEGPARTARTVRARARISCVDACSCPAAAF